MKKILLITNVLSQVLKFNLHNIEILQKLGCSVDVACNTTDYISCPKEICEKTIKILEKINVSVFHIDFGRRIKGQLLFVKPLHQLSLLVKHNKYDLIHCNSQIGGLCGRIVSHRNNCKVIYTAHGFPFFKGSSLTNWLFAYPQDKILSKFTNVLICINLDDYLLATEKFWAKKIIYLPGVGVDLNKFRPVSQEVIQNLRKELFINKNEKIIVSIGEINKNKNHITVIKSLMKINSIKWKYIICGKGPLQNKLEKFIKQNGLVGKVFFAGYRSDISNILQITDLFIMPSYREGLSVALMEAMASKVAILASDIRGNKDLIKNPNYRFKPSNHEELSEKIIAILSKNNNVQIKENFDNLEKYSSTNVDKIMANIYEKELG